MGACVCIHEKLRVPDMISVSVRAHLGLVRKLPESSQLCVNARVSGTVASMF
jgi:hypothetical protein